VDPAHRPSVIALEMAVYLGKGAVTDGRQQRLGFCASFEPMPQPRATASE
jgi:hypothetical protein